MFIRPGTRTLRATALACAVLAPLATTAEPTRCLVLFAEDTSQDGTRSVEVSAASEPATGPDAIATAKSLAQEAIEQTGYDLVDVLIVPIPKPSGNVWTPADIDRGPVTVRLRHAPQPDTTPRASQAWSVQRPADVVHGPTGALTSRAVADMSTPDLGPLCDYFGMREALLYALDSE